MLSCIALVVSLWSLWLSRRRDRREAARHHDDQKPDLRCGIDEVGGGLWYDPASPIPEAAMGKFRLWVEMHSPEPLTGLTVEFLEDVGLIYEGDDEGKPLATPGRQCSRRAPLSIGDRATWWTLLHVNAPTEARLRTTARRGRKKWVQLHDIEVPYDIARSIF